MNRLQVTKYLQSVSFSRNWHGLHQKISRYVDNIPNILKKRVDILKIVC